MRWAALLAALSLAGTARAQDLYARASTPRAVEARRLAARAAHLEFVSGLPARFLDLFSASPTRAERDALRLEALRTAERALAISPEDPSLLGLSAALRERLGDYERARIDADRALALAPEGPDAPDHLFTRALIRTRQGDHLGTREDYLRALRFPMTLATRATVLGNLADTYLALGDTTLAVETFTRCVRDAPDYSLAWLGLAVALDRQGDDPTAASAEALHTSMARSLGRPDAILDELSREGVFFVPAWDRHTYEAMAHEALARAYTRGELPGGDASLVGLHRAAARTAWQAWSARAPADDPWRPVVQRHLSPERASPSGPRASQP